MIIDNYYRDKIQKIENEINIKHDEKRKEFELRMKNDEKIRKVYEIIEEKNLEFNDLLSISFYINDYKFSKMFNKLEEIIELKNKKVDLESEKMKVLLTLETNSKNSKEYKDCLEEFNKKLGI